MHNGSFEFVMYFATHSKIRIVIMTTVVCYGVGDDEHITCIDTAR